MASDRRHRTAEAVPAETDRPAGAIQTPRPDRPRLRILLQAVLALLVLAGAGATVAWFMSTEPGAGRGAAQRQETAVLVQTTTVVREPEIAVVEAWGEVTPADRVTVTPRVSGEVVEVSDKLESGGRVAKGDLLVQLDRSDYRIALERARTALAKAQADLEIEQGNQRIAETEAELLDQELSAQERQLVLRQPQLESARADVEAARADVRAAELDLQRTTVRAPFDAVVQTADVEVGSQVGPGDSIAELVATDRYYVELAVPAAKLQYVTAAEETPGSGSLVTFDNPTVWGSETRTGEVVRVRPGLSQEGRMARLLVAVEQPLDRRPRLLVGSYLRGRIQGASLGEVVALDRAYLREDDSVWVMTGDGRLEIRAVDVAYRGPQDVYISVGLSEGERVVTSDIATPTNGMRLRTRDGGGAA